MILKVPYQLLENTCLISELYSSPEHRTYLQLLTRYYAKRSYAFLYFTSKIGYAWVFEVLEYSLRDHIRVSLLQATSSLWICGKHSKVETQLLTVGCSIKSKDNKYNQLTNLTLLSLHRYFYEYSSFQSRAYNQ